MPSRALALALAALLVSACAAAADTPATDTAPPPTVTASPFPTALPIADTPLPEWREYLNDRYHVSLWVPGQWQALEAGPGFQGADGFVGLTMLGDDGGQITLEAACAAQAYHTLQPFGSAPEVTAITVSGQPACLIRPSADQPLTANSLPLAEAIIRYPEPVHLDGARYQFLILDADPANIQPLLDRLTLILFDSLNTPTPPAPAAAAPPPPGEAARPAATAAGGCARAHTVQPGEGLAAIGRQYGLSWEAV
ncbi:MAG: LysM peptidoglycan-binding domain-containing protein, partial [Anaerolineales bacterium]|nr:LysM peptidoglycan-binding domain-containing protein [Anaerolineales bacterium]